MLAQVGGVTILLSPLLPSGMTTSNKKLIYVVALALSFLLRPPPPSSCRGRNDEILGTESASKFHATLPRSRLVWVESCGHCPHLEQPEFTAAQVLSFISEAQEGRAGGGGLRTLVPAEAV